MTERGLPLADGASACPFVAFDDDRDERASVPDHRHRCYAETRPAPRALAHQEAYCLSSAFPVCPTFQDWARREAARARGVADAAAAATAASAAEAATGAAAGPVGAVGAAAGADGDEPADRGPADEEADAPAGGERSHDATDADEFGVRRNPPRDWAAPPPWLASAEAGARGESEPPPFLSHRAAEPGQGLAGSAADRLAGGPQREAGPAPVERRSVDRDEHGPGGTGADAFDDPDRDAEPPRRPTRRPRAYEQHLGGTDGPDWERPRRYEAYPTIKTGMNFPNLSRVAVMAAAVGVAAVALFFLPAILGIGGGGGPAGSVRASVAPSASVAPTEPPAPTPFLYTIKKNDTLSKIATAHGITVAARGGATPLITNPHRWVEGQPIPTPSGSEAPPEEIGGSAEPSAAP